MIANELPLVVHIVHRFDIGGLENGIVNLINHSPARRYRHAIVALTECNTAFVGRLHAPTAVPCYSLHKRPGHDIRLYWRLFKILRALRPALVHTRNLATLETQVVAWIACVRGRIHGEHGRDIHDMDGTNRRYQRLRRLIQPLVQRYIPLSRDLEHWLLRVVGVPPEKIAPICNGVDHQRFQPRSTTRVSCWSGMDEASIVIGTIGRMQAVKDQVNLARAFIHLVAAVPAWRTRLRLVMIGAGPLREQAISLLTEAGIADLCWLPGARDDTPEVLRSFDIFVLPSRAEGISNTILEAMSTGLPVVATHVGGNSELVLENATGFLVPPNDPVALAQAIEVYVRDEHLRHVHGRAGRARIEAEFTLQGMVARYFDIYDQVVARSVRQQRYDRG